MVRFVCILVMNAPSSWRGISEPPESRPGVSVCWAATHAERSTASRPISLLVLVYRVWRFLHELRVPLAWIRTIIMCPVDWLGKGQNIFLTPLAQLGGVDYVESIGVVSTSHLPILALAFLTCILQDTTEKRGPGPYLENL